MPILISTIAHFLSRSVSYVPRCYSSMRKNMYRSYFFMRRCSYVFYFFTRISSTTLKFTRELSRKDGTRNRYRSDTDTVGLMPLLKPSIPYPSSPLYSPFAPLCSTSICPFTPLHPHCRWWGHLTTA